MNAPQTAIAKVGASSLAMDETQLITVLENSLYPGASSTSIALVINYCRAAGLDPMQKPVHIVPMWDNKASRMRDVIMPGVGLYRTQAARTNQLAGITEPEFGPDITEEIGGVRIIYPAWCRVTVKRAMPSGAVAEFAAVERWKENYAVKGGKEKSIAPNAMWMRRPYAQLAKCSQAQALRMAFPEMTGSQPTADEMEGKPIDDFAGTTIDGATGEVVQKKELPAYSDEQFRKNLPAWRDMIASGKKSADQIIATVETKGKLTDEQKASIRATPAKTEAPADGDGVMSDDEVAAIHAREMAEAGQ
jgi:phage recombination protein Bet